MLKIGLTGGIGCGKSTAISLFKQFGVSIIDADRIAKQLVQLGQPALQDIEKCFGSDFIQADGQLDRALLKEEIFSNKAQLDKLEAILHPRIRRAISMKMDELLLNNKKLPKSNYFIVDVPLLVEKGYQDLFDEIIVVDCTESQQLQRTLKRDLLNEAAVQAIISKQATRKERLEIATETLDNTSSIAVLVQQVEALHTKFTR